MHSKSDSSSLKHLFWTRLGQYLSPIPAAGERKVNWINYKTGIKFLKFRMDADSNHAYIAIELSEGSMPKQQAIYERFLLLKDELEKSGTWTFTRDSEKTKEMKIYRVLGNVNVYNQDDWPQMISFLKGGMMCLDKFWWEHHELFEMIQ